MSCRCLSFWEGSGKVCSRYAALHAATLDTSTLSKINKLGNVTPLHSTSLNNKVRYSIFKRGERRV